MESHISLPVMQDIEQNTVQEIIVVNQSEELVEKLILIRRNQKKRQIPYDTPDSANCGRYN
ncbi:hypothetical protein H5410_004324 [Solanum commersonii]|uniref:Uncharacterized protein n=1 Tax=Solanum commersonii TaxID=4109 RepID=A0A9J6B852_SOLCO|nr:hypothetical protein H5410_004324 [Solanum commersonii]